jgi:trigger factor
LQFSAPVRSPDGTEDEADVRVLVKDVKEKILPEATDAWAAEASEFETLDELRADLEARMRQVKVVEAQMAMRERTLDALIGLVVDDPPDALVESEVRERLHDLGHRLQARRLTVEQFLEVSGRDEGQLLAEIRSDAARAVRLDLALRALADAEEILVTDDELEESVTEMATQAGTTAGDLRRRLDRTGRLPAVRSDRRKSKALTWLFDHVGLVDEEGRPLSREDLELEEPTLRAHDVGEVGDADDADGGEGNRGSEGVQADERRSGESPS